MDKREHETWDDKSTVGKVAFFLGTLTAVVIALTFILILMAGCYAVLKAVWESVG